MKTNEVVTSTKDDISWLDKQALSLFYGAYDMGVMLSLEVIHTNYLRRKIGIGRIRSTTRGRSYATHYSRCHRFSNFANP